MSKIFLNIQLILIIFIAKNKRKMFAEKSLMATNLQNNNPKATSIFTHKKAYAKKVIYL